MGWRRRGLGVWCEDHGIPAQLIEVLLQVLLALLQVLLGPQRCGRGEYPRSDVVGAAYRVAPAFTAVVGEGVAEFF